MKDTVPFDDPKWRSPLTGSTKAEVLVMRDNFRSMVARVQTVNIERNRLASEEYFAEKAALAELARLEQEERDAAAPIKSR